MKRDAIRQLLREIEGLATDGLDWVTFSARVGDRMQRVIDFDRTCWHAVDPGTYLFTGSASHGMTCSGSWLAEHEYVLDDVNKWHDLAHSGQLAGSLSDATHGNLSLSPRFRSSADYGEVVSDELRVSFVVDGAYWGAAGLIRGQGGRRFDADEVRTAAALSAAIADGFRRGLLATEAGDQPVDQAPGVVVLDGAGQVRSMSPSAEHLIALIVETPPPATPGESRIVQAVAGRARRLMADPHAGLPPPRARVRTLTGQWLRLYATPLSGEHGELAVIIQPAGSHDVAPLVARAYGLTERERLVTRLCLEGRSTRDIAAALHISEYTVQDHLKAIFRKTGTRTRAELVGQVFLEHYVSRFEEVGDVGGGWQAHAIPEPAADPAG